MPPSKNKVPARKKQSKKSGGTKKAPSKKSTSKNSFGTKKAPTRSNNSSGKKKTPARKTLSKNSFGTNDFPEYNIKKNNGFASVDMTLTGNDKFVVESKGLFYIEQNENNQVSVETSTGGVLAGIARMFSGENLFVNTISAPKKKGKATITFGSCIPGDILDLVIAPGETFMASKGSFIAGSENIKVKAGIRMRGALSGEGAVLTKLVNESTTDGLVFLACYGGIDKFNLKTEDDTCIVDNGLFLAAKVIPDKKLYELTALGGGAKTFILGGEGILMKFKGPQKVYVQNRNINHFANTINLYLPRKR